MAKSNLTLYFEALRSSPRLVGVKVLFGRKELANQGSPRRIVLVPVGGDFAQGPEDQDNLADLQCVVSCRCWGSDHDHLRDVTGALLQATFEYRLASDVNVQHVKLLYDIDPDTASEGEAATVVMVLRDPYEPAGGSSAVVAAEQITGTIGTEPGPTYNKP